MRDLGLGWTQHIFHWTSPNPQAACTGSSFQLSACSVLAVANSYCLERL